MKSTPHLHKEVKAFEEAERRVRRSQHEQYCKLKEHNLREWFHLLKRHSKSNSLKSKDLQI